MNDKVDSIQQRFDEKKDTIIEAESQSNHELNRLISKCQQQTHNWNEFSGLAQNTFSDDPFKRYSGLIGIRRLLNAGTPLDESLFQKVIDAGLIPKLLEFMEKDDEPQLQMEATWVLICMAAGTYDQVEELIDQGAVPVLVRLLKSCHTQLIEKAALTIANIATDNLHREILLDYGVLHLLIAVLEGALEKKDITLVQSSTRALSNLCRVKPFPAYEKVADATPIFCRVVKEFNDVEILRDALWALCYHSNAEYKLPRILEVDVVPSLIQYLDFHEDSIMIPAVRILGNIVAGSDDQADAVLKVSSTRSFIKKLFKLLKQRPDRKSLQREVCWVLSNITCQSSEYIDLVIGIPEHIDQLVNVTLYDIFEVQKEAVLVLGNATMLANKNQMISMIRSGVFDCFCKVIHQYQSAHLNLILKPIQNFLNFEASMSRKQATNNKCLINLKQMKIIKIIKESRENRNFVASKLAHEIWNRYLKGDLLRKNLRLKRAIICFKNRRHSLLGLFQNKKKRLSI